MKTMPKSLFPVRIKRKYGGKQWQLRLDLR